MTKINEQIIFIQELYGWWIRFDHGKWYVFNKRPNCFLILVLSSLNRLLKKQFRLTLIDHQSVENSKRKTYFEMDGNEFSKKQKQIFKKIETSIGFSVLVDMWVHISHHNVLVCEWIYLNMQVNFEEIKKKQFQPWWKKSIKRKNNWKFHPEIIPILSYSVWTYCNEFKIKKKVRYLFAWMYLCVCIWDWMEFRWCSCGLNSLHADTP